MQREDSESARDVNKVPASDVRVNVMHIRTQRWTPIQGLGMNSMCTSTQLEVRCSLQLEARD